MGTELYSPKIIERTIDTFEAKNGWRPEYHSIPEIDEWKAYLESLTTYDENNQGRTFFLKDGLRLTERRRKEIAKFVQSENFLCFADSAYWESRYAWICDEKNEIFRYQPRKSQQIFHKILEPFDENQFAIELFCLDPTTKILTADLRWVKIDDLKVGDELVSVDEGETPEQVKQRRHAQYKKNLRGEYGKRPNHERRGERKMRPCKVEAKWESVDYAIRITLDDGRELVAGPHHQFLAKQSGGSDPEWREAKKFVVGDKIRQVTMPWTESSYEDGWFGGFADGEGSQTRNRSGSAFCVTQRFNNPYYRARGYLRRNGYHFGEEVDNRTPEDSTVLGTEPVGRLTLSRMDELFRLFGQTRPSRFVGNRWWEGKCLPGKKSGTAWATVTSVESMPRQRLIDIQTSTRTFIAEGFVSHNCIKSRQVGITTSVAMKFLHRLLFIPNTQAVMASVRTASSELIGRMLDVCSDRQPFWLGPAKTSVRAATPKWENGSILSIQSGSQAMGIAQGWTPTCTHVSEVADIPRPKKVIEEGLFPAVHSSRKSFFVLEGTGGDSTSWQADKWRYYKQEWGKGGRFMPMFITWPCATDLYPQPDWLRQHPVPELWRPLDETKRMQRKAELYIRSTDYLARIMGANWSMPPEQAWFWETKYREAVQSHTVKVFLSQYPVTDDEALQSKDDLVFSEDVIADVGSRSEKQYEAYAVTGKSVLIGQNDEPYEPDQSEIDYEKPRIQVSWKSKSGQMNYWEMVPLRQFNDLDDTQSFNKVLIFKHPEEGCNYTEGIDTADGLGYPDEDRSVCTVLENHTGMERDEEAATFVSNGVNPPQMVSIAACLAAYYGQWYDGRPHTKDPRGVKFIIEQRARYGDDCQHQLKLMGFFWHHLFHTYDDKTVRRDQGRKLGWFSNAWSVPMLLNRFQDALQGGWLKISHPMTIRQLKTWVRKTGATGKTKLDHESGKHDDNLRAIAMAYFTAHDDDVLVNRQQAKYGNPHERQPEINYGWLENTITV